MVWVWGENSPDAALESALTPALLIPELADEEALKSGKVSPGNVGHNDMSYGWDTLMENLLVSFFCLCVSLCVAGFRKTPKLDFLSVSFVLETRLHKQCHSKPTAVHATAPHIPCTTTGTWLYLGLLS